MWCMNEIRSRLRELLGLGLTGQAAATEAGPLFFFFQVRFKLEVRATRAFKAAARLELKSELRVLAEALLDFGFDYQCSSVKGSGHGNWVAFYRAVLTIRCRSEVRACEFAVRGLRVD